MSRLIEVVVIGILLRYCALCGRIIPAHDAWWAVNCCKAKLRERISMSSIFGKIKHGFHHAAHEVEHTVEHAAHEASDLAHEAGDAIEKLGGAATMNLVHEVEHALHSVEAKIEGEIKHLAAEATHDIEGLGNKIKHEGETLKHEFQADVLKAEKGLKAAAEKAGTELKKDAIIALHEAETLAENAAKAVLAEISGKVLHTIVQGLKILVPISERLVLGPVILNITNLHDRIDVLEKWAHNPPRDRSHIREIIQEIAPDTVEINLEVAFAFLFIESESLALGNNPTFHTDLFLDKFEELLNHYGIRI